MKISTCRSSMGALVTPIRAITPMALGRLAIFCLVVLSIMLPNQLSAQQSVFNRDNSGTGDWGSGNLPWFYQTSNNNQGDPDNGNTIRNDVFIGHNNNTTMTLNGRFYIHRDFTFQAGASSARTLNNSSGGGFSFTRSLVNASTATHVFNTPVGIDANNAEIRLDNASGGNLTFNGSVFTNSNQTFIRYNNGNTGTITFNGAMTQGGSFVKQGGGTLAFTGTANFPGSIFIDQGTVRFGLAMSSNVIEIGGNVAGSTAFNATMEINSNVTVSKSITVRNFNNLGGGRTLNFTHTTGVATASGNIALERVLTIDNGSGNSGATLSGILSGAGGITKTGAGVLTLSNANTYTGSTTVNGGTLTLGVTNALPVSASAGLIRFAAGTPTWNLGLFNLGSSTAAANSAGSLDFDVNTIVNLGASGTNVYYFKASNGQTWDATTVTINNWTGTRGESGTGPRIFIGSDATGLSTAQLAKITFTGFGAGATVLPTGEVVPALPVYQSRQSGNWGDFNTWERSTDGGATFVNAVTGQTPTSADGQIRIRNLHTVSVINSVTVDQVVVDAGGTLSFANNNLTIANGPGTDLDVSGTFIQAAASGTLTVSGQIAVQNGGLVQQAKIGTAIPTATWNTGSTCEVTGWQTTLGGGIDQAFSNFTWNCASQTVSLVLEPTSMSVAGTFRVQSTGGSTDALVLGNSSTSRTLSVGSLDVSGGNFYVAGTSATASMTLNITGNYNQSGGFFEVGRSNASGASCTVGGTFTITGGTTRIMNNSGTGGVVSTLTITGATLINGGTLDINATGITNAGRLFVRNNLTIQAGALVYSQTSTVGSSGVYFDGSSAQSFVHAGGTIDNGSGGIGRRFYYRLTGGPTALNETYSASVAQTTINGTEGSAFTGYAAWPTSGTLISNLTVNNTAGVTLSTPKSISGTLTLTAGSLNTTNTNLLHIVNTLSSAISGGSSSSFVNGPLRWSVANSGGGTYVFPLGKGSTYLPLSFGSPVGTAPILTAEAFATNPGITVLPNCVNSLSNTEYWAVSNTGTLTSASLSVAKASLGGQNVIARSTSLTSGYTSLGGSITSSLITSNTVLAGTSVGSLATLTYFVLGEGTPAVSISSLSASTGFIGSTLVITGISFTGATSVTIGGTAAASFVVNSNTQITATLGTGSNGAVVVTTPCGSATSAGNFTFAGYGTAQDGDWNTPATWLGGNVPPAGATITIDHQVSVNASVANAPASLTINANDALTIGTLGALTATTVTNNGTLAWSGAGTLTIAAGGTLSNNATFTRGTGLVTFSGSGTVSGTVNFNNVTINAGVNFGTASTVSGTLTLNSGSFVIGNAPVYASGSTLRYSTGGPYNRSLEWSATSGAGYPHHVIVTNNTTLNVNNGTNVARQIAGDLTIDAGSTFSMQDMNIGAPTVIGVTVLGNIINNGTVTLASTTERLRCTNYTNNTGATTTLSSNGGGDLEVTGNLIDNGTFNANTRAVFFTGAGNQDISGSGTFNIDYFVSIKSGGRIRMLNNLLCEGPNGGNAITLSNTTDTLDLNGFTLTAGRVGVASGITGAGFIRGGGSSSIILQGNGAFGTIRFDQSIDGTTNQLKDFTLNRTSSGSVTIDNSVQLKDVLTVTAGTLNLNSGDFTLISDATGTARVAAVGASGSFGYLGAGRFIHQRYLPGPAKRAWRLITVPLSNTNSMFDSWQNGGTFTAERGMHITGPGATGPSGNGLDVSTTNNTSLRLWNPSTQAYFNLTNTKTSNVSQGTGNSAANTGYFAFVRGDRTPSFLDFGSTGTSVTTLSARGRLQFGDQVFTNLASSSGQFTLIGNPYAAPVDMNLVFGNTGTNRVQRAFYAWDSRLAGANGVGGYVAVSEDAPGVFIADPDNTGISEILQSGQAVFIMTDAGSGSPAIEFKESNKVTTTTQSFFRPTNTLNTIPVFRANLHLLNTADNSIQLADGASARFATTFCDCVDNQDNIKLTNTNETFGFVRSGTFLATERRANLLTTMTDTLQLRLTRSSERSYQLHLIPQSLPGGLTARLIDSYTNVETPLSLTDTNRINFVINADAASKNQDRFRVVFGPMGGPLPVTFTNITARQQNRDIEVSWDVANQINIARYEVERAADGRSFRKVADVTAVGANGSSNTYRFVDVNPTNGDHFYRVRSVDRDGQTQLTRVVRVTIGSGKTGITVYPNPVRDGVVGIQLNNLPAGVYQVRLMNMSGQQVMSQVLNHVGGSAAEQLRPASILSKGLYQLELIATEGGSRLTTQIVVE